MDDSRAFVRLDGTAVTLVFALERGGAADCIYLGAALPAGEDLAALAASNRRGSHESQPDTPPVPGLFAERKGGWAGMPAMTLRKDGAVLDTDLRVSRWEGSEQRLEIMLRDERLGAELTLTWEIGVGDAVMCQSRLENTGSETFALDHLASLAVPIPHRFTHMTRFSGRWAGEMREHYRPIAPDGFAGGSAIGKPGFTGSNWVLLHDPISGESLGAHLGWSGDHTTMITCDNQGAADGRSILQMAPVWEDGAVVLEPGHSSWVYAPKAVFLWGESKQALTQNFHRHVRQDVLRTRELWSERKVHLNTWEALGFDLSTEAIMQLVDQAARLGVERFVLDDGWFGGRRDDQTSLGDWHVADHLNLDAVIAHVHSLSMDFGLWVEPEMVSPDSDLYREHSDWCLHTESDERPTMRGQLVLDLRREEVCDYLFAKLSSLLGEHAIAYLKWDHNRDLFPRSHAQTERLYALIDRLRSAHPKVEIESCASGGGRIDFGILARTHRVWPSDNNDPLERVRII
ncbi:MAG: alpha-galactosidase, partial [Pseudomonadota bacterium]